MIQKSCKIHITNFGDIPKVIRRGTLFGTVGYSADVEIIKFNPHPEPEYDLKSYYESYDPQVLTTSVEKPDGNLDEVVMGKENVSASSQDKIASEVK